MSATLDQRLIKDCIDGDSRAQKRLFDMLAPKMMAVCLRYMGERSLAEDILQDGFVSLFTKLSSYSGSGSFEGWARKIFVNTALMALRRNDALKMSEDISELRNMRGDTPSQLDQIGYKEIMKLVTALPTGYRTVFNMYAVEGWSHKEIAAALGISEGTSRSQFLRARAMLQDGIAKLNEHDRG